MAEKTLCERVECAREVEAKCSTVSIFHGSSGRNKKSKACVPADLWLVWLARRPFQTPVRPTRLRDLARSLSHNVTPPAMPVSSNKQHRVHANTDHCTHNYALTDLLLSLGSLRRNICQTMYLFVGPARSLIVASQ